MMFGYVGGPCCEKIVLTYLSIGVICVLLCTALRMGLAIMTLSVVLFRRSHEALALDASSFAILRFSSVSGLDKSTPPLSLVSAELPDV